MKVGYVPVLQILRDLYVQPRGMQRFQKYVATLTGGTQDVVLPIGVANPMATDHAVAKIDELLALGAETIGAAAAANAHERLERIPLAFSSASAGGTAAEGEIKASVVLADDVGGGWTNRYTTETSVRFPRRGALKRPFATALVWTSESPTRERLHQEVLAAIYRVAYQQRFGLPATLASMLEQEGLAGVFADARPSLATDELNAARDIIARLGAEPAYPLAFASMYGDAAADQLGYRALGLPPRAGFEVALAGALERRIEPVRVLE